MEVWLGQMGPVGSTANVLEAQIREQKVSNLNQTLNSFKVLFGTFLYRKNNYGPKRIYFWLHVSY